MIIAVTIVHNKGTVANAAQITALAALLTVQGNAYKFTSVLTPHEVRVYQVVPYEVTRPSNMNTLNSHNVIYGAGDEDKTSDHLRFFNWALKRGTDHGADVAVQFDSLNLLNVASLFDNLTAITSPSDPLNYMEGTFGRMASLKLLKDVGQMNEGLSIANAITDLKSRLTTKGMTYG